ncbi:hypothetical protein BH10CHL1_BH10CHL1_28720 [soil metagenome]
MQEQFQPGDYFEQYSPTNGQVVARGIVLKTEPMHYPQLLTVEYEDCPTWSDMRQRTAIVLSLWCRKISPQTKDELFS